MAFVPHRPHGAHLCLPKLFPIVLTKLERTWSMMYAVILNVKVNELHVLADQWLVGFLRDNLLRVYVKYTQDLLLTKELFVEITSENGKCALEFVQTKVSYNWKPLILKKKKNWKPFTFKKKKTPRNPWIPELLFIENIKIHKLIFYGLLENKLFYFFHVPLHPTCLITKNILIVVLLLEN